MNEQTKMAPQAQMAEDKTPFQIALVGLGGQIDSLTIEIALLRDRVGSVLIPAREEPKETVDKVVEDTPTMSDVTYHLNVLAGKVNSMRDTVLDIRERVDL